MYSFPHCCVVYKCSKCNLHSTQHREIWGRDACTKSLAAGTSLVSADRSDIHPLQHLIANDSQHMQDTEVCCHPLKVRSLVNYASRMTLIQTTFQSNHHYSCGLFVILISGSPSTRNWLFTTVRSSPRRRPQSRCSPHWRRIWDVASPRQSPRHARCDATSPVLQLCWL